MPSGKIEEITAMAVDFPSVEGHPNRCPFEGVLTLVDVPSDRALSGSRGHRVVLTRKAVQEALPSLLGMAVGFCPEWDGHGARSRCGIITSASIQGNCVHVEGFLYSRDFPEVHSRLASLDARNGDMGMSYELANAYVEDMRASVWYVHRATFTGAAILLREKAAYKSTAFRLKA